MTERDFEDLSLAELLGQLIRAPRQTLRALWVVVAPLKRERIVSPRLTVPVAETEAPQTIAFSAEAVRQLLRLGGYVLAMLIAWYGDSLLVARHPGVSYGLPGVDFAAGRPFLFFAFALVLLTELIIHLPRLRQPREQAPTVTAVNQELDGVRVIPFFIGLALAIAAYALNGNNRFTLVGVITWISSITLVVGALIPPNWDVFASVQQVVYRIISFPRRETRTFLVVLLITGLAAFLRLQNLDLLVPEMTSDHVEKLLDAQHISEGQYRVFMEENGGRESLHFYLLALLDQLPGVDLNFMALKILSALEGIITIPIFWWMGRELIGERDRRLGNYVGIALALVGAVAYWHLQLSRIALRISLTPLVGALLMIYLARAMRFNRRVDYLKAGLILGIGLYTYQAVRMMPLLVIAGGILALLFNVRSWRLARAYTVNFVILALVAFIVFVPLFRYSVQYPQSFWSRTSGRLMGEDTIRTTNELGQIITRQATFSDRIEALNTSVKQLGTNIVNALLMFNYRGDIIFLHNAPDYPHLDPLLGALLIVGLAGWIVWIIRHRDAVNWLILPGILILLLPSALAIAAPNENPSTTRASGALPLVLFLVAFGVATIASSFDQIPLFGMKPGRRRVPLLILAILLVIGVYSYTSWVMFSPYRILYFQSWHPISMGGRIMHGFAESGGDYGNAFVLRYRYWWDYRAIAMEAGLKPDVWNNGDIGVDELPQRMSEAWRGISRFPLDPTRDLLIFYHKDDVDAENKLKAWFPQGYSTYVSAYITDINNHEVEVAFPDKDFKYYRVPALGEEGFRAFLTAAGVQ